MVMNGVRLLGLFIQSLEVLSDVYEPKLPLDCGYSPEFAGSQVVGGEIIDPDVYSWMVSLRYGNTDEDGVCGGSVINSRYVLTAAHCVEGEKIRSHGNLTGVRLGDFSKESCDYGTSACHSYLHFGIEHIKKHEQYHVGKERIIHNDIALIRVNERIPFNNKLKPICLPNGNVTEPIAGEMLIVSGWGRSLSRTETVAKRAVAVPLVTDSQDCQYKSPSRMCAGVLANNINFAKTSCDGDSGGPLMKQWQRGKMVIIGIVSFVPGMSCVSEFHPTHYTRVRYFFYWIEANLQMP